MPLNKTTRSNATPVSIMTVRMRFIRFSVRKVLGNTWAPDEPRRAEPWRHARGCQSIVLEQQDLHWQDRPRNDAYFPKVYSSSFFSSIYVSVHKALRIDRKSTRLNSSHSQISYAVFC